jgi:hypothetical protein
MTNTNKYVMIAAQIGYAAGVTLSFIVLGGVFLLGLGIGGL